MVREGRETWLKFVRLREVDRHLKLGWLPSGIDGGLIGSRHAQYAIIMQWICECPIP